MSNKSIIATPVSARHANIANAIAFIILGMTFSAWSMGVPAFRENLTLTGAAGDFSYGMIALAVGVGSVVGSLLAGRLFDLLGGRTMMLVVCCAFGVSFFPLGLVQGHVAAGIIGCLMGGLRGALDTILNSHGVQIEAAYQRPMMAKFHACLSVGMFLFAIIAGYVTTGQESSAFIGFAVMGGLCIFAGLMLSRYFMHTHVEPSSLQVDKGARGTSQSLKITMLAVMLGLLIACGVVCEGAVIDWGVDFMRRTLDAPTLIAGYAISVFTVGELIGRLIGDKAARVLGRPQTMAASGIVAVLGIVLMTQSGSHLVSLAGFCLLGIGVACNTPLLISTAGNAHPANRGRNVGTVIFVGYCGALVGPGAAAFIVDDYGINYVFAFPAVLMALVAIFGPMLMRKRRSAAIGQEPQPV